MSRHIGESKQQHAGRQFGATQTPGDLRLFNTLTRQVEAIEPLEPGHVRLYSCGPTVYRFIHIGNLRTFTMADWIRRTLTYHGLQVTHIKNITDVGHMRQERLDRGEDKLIAQARREGKSPWEIAAFYTDAFMSDETSLHILPAHIFPRATDHIPEMIALTQRLLERGYAYEAQGNVFFSVAAFTSYGQLSGNILDYLGSGLHTVNENDPYKRAPEDFPLWKVAEEGRIMAWESPWGKGFPGWHIECSAMSAKYLGEEIDIHTGGVDNIFPHHEDERAQSEAASGHRFVRYWVHGQHLLADGLKMAKSTGNAYTLADVEARGFEPLALRYFFTTAKYRSRINFTFRALRAAQTALLRLRERAYELYDSTGGAVAASSAVREHPYHQAFIAAMDDDLNLPRAMAVVWTMLRDATVPSELRLALLYDVDQILGFDFAADVARYAERHHTGSEAGAGQIAHIETDTTDVPEPVLTLAQERAQERVAHNYAAADALRARIAEAGYDVRDGRSSTRLVKHVEQEELISSSGDVASQLEQPAACAFSVNLIAHNSRADLERCVESIARHAGGRSIELVIVDNGSTDDTLAYVRQLHHDGQIHGIPVRVLFADHDMGFGAGRNATFRASLGEVMVLLDTSIELSGDIWTPIEAALSDPTIGLVGPFGLITHDLKEYEESMGPDVDAMEGYLMAFRRAALLEVGPANEKFRFYRLMDVDYSLEFKKAGYRVVVSDAIRRRVIMHPHREWHSLSAEEQATKSKHNFDIYWRRRHHSQSLLVANYRPGQAAPWGHDHALASLDVIDPRFEHLPYAESALHVHEHKHWPDHAHTHPHAHTPGLRWLGGATALATYVPGYAESASGTQEAEEANSGEGRRHDDRA